MNQLEQWCAERADVFDLDDDGEHKLEWTELHEQFCLLFERRITKFLEDDGHSVEVRAVSRVILVRVRRFARPHRSFGKR